MVSLERWLWRQQEEAPEGAQTQSLPQSQQQQAAPMMMRAVRPLLLPSPVAAARLQMASSLPEVVRRSPPSQKLKQAPLVLLLRCSRQRGARREEELP